MKIVFILLDSLNRRFLKAYGASNDAAITPNIDRLANRSVVFDEHWCGSAPCMPARRDIMTGRLNFMERPWGGIEPFDCVLPSLLKTAGVYTRMETDHYHYAEKGGENYFSDFTSWQLHRGAESDKLFFKADKHGLPDLSGFGAENKKHNHYEQTRAHYANKPDAYSTPRTLLAATQWLKDNRDADNFFLWVEGFDPHEPFDVPPKYVEQYGEAYKADFPYWPKYAPSSEYTEEQVRYFKVLYKALLTMTDEYVGKLLDVLDEQDVWKDTMVVLTTDHGYMLGEHGFMAKNYMPDYNEVHHIPLMIAAPNVAPTRCNALTQNIDLFPTFLQTFGVSLDLRNRIHGKSLLPLLNGKSSELRKLLIFGTFSKSINVYDGRYVYIRRPVSSDNQPLFIYGADMNVLNNSIGYDTIADENYDKIEMGRFLNWTKYPVYRVAARYVNWNNNSLRFEKTIAYLPTNLLFDLKEDYLEEHPIDSPELEQEMIAKLKYGMQMHDAPSEQYVRLGIE